MTTRGVREDDRWRRRGAALAVLACWAHGVSLAEGAARAQGVSPAEGAARAQGVSPAEGAGHAQGAPSRPLRLGVFFWHASANDAAAFEGIRAAFAARGVEHEFDVRRADGDEARARGFMRAWSDGGVDLVFALGTRAAHLSQGWLGSTPIVFAAVTNPVEAGLVASWGPRFERRTTLVRQTGTSNWVRPETVLRVFRLARPGLRRLGVLRSSSTGYVSAVELRGMRRAADAAGGAGLELVESIYERRFGVEAAVQRLLDARVDAIWIPIDYEIYENSAGILAAVAGRGVPLLSSSLRATRDAAVAGIFVDYELLGQRAAAQAMRVLLGGAAPERMTVETMKSYQIVVNRDAAERCGYELPLSLLAVADRVLPELVEKAEKAKKVENPDAGSKTRKTGKAGK